MIDLCSYPNCGYCLLLIFLLFVFNLAIRFSSRFEAYTTVGWRQDRKKITEKPIERKKLKTVIDKELFY